MPTTIGLDTTVIIGMLDAQDIWHQPAIDLLAALESHSFEPVIFDCVLSEAVSTLARRIHEKRRVSQLSTLMKGFRTRFPSKSIVWLYPDLPNLYDDVILLVEQSSGELNFNDALIALSCRARGIAFLASFDKDFDQVDWLTRISTPSDLSV